MTDTLAVAIALVVLGVAALGNTVHCLILARRIRRLDRRVFDGIDALVRYRFRRMSEDSRSTLRLSMLERRMDDLLRLLQAAADHAEDDAPAQGSDDTSG